MGWVNAQVKGSHYANIKLDNHYVCAVDWILCYTNIVKKDNHLKMMPFRVSVSVQALSKQSVLKLCAIQEKEH